LNKTLYRSRKNRIIAGVCGGIGEYFGVDPWLIRILFIITGIGLLAYLVCAIFIPEEPVQF
jgi:phage shock protein PspC (stress-responsive transcriptional regulator)